jgi:serine/threonine protein kinase
MGEVYRGLDTRLNRPVAIKKSAEQFSDRFNTEARAIAALNHPHVCTLYDVGPDYLVMELIEGDTLAGRLTRGALPVADVVRFGAQIASALAAAHAKGIVHRDLKPGNVMLTGAGVKVLDFGIAKMSGLVTETLTATRGIVGTPAYMAPEQLAGGVADWRSDIYTLGLVLAEMATGRRLEVGRDPGAALASLPEPLAHVIERCLANDPAARWQSAADVGRELEWAARAQSATRPASRSAVRHGAIAAASLAVLVVAFIGIRSLRNAAPDRADAPPMSTSIALPAGLRLDPSAPLAISPDGTHLVFAARNDQGDRSLYLRPLASNTATELSGTQGGNHPFFSPDGRAIGYFTSDALHRVGIDGSAPLRVCPLPGIDHGGAWGGDDTIVVAIRGQGFFKVKASGGTLELIAKDLLGAWPSFLPDGKTLLYSGFSNAARRPVRVSTVSLDGTGRRDIARLSDEDGGGAPVLGASAEIQQVALLPQGQLLFGQDPGYVRALPIDPETLTPRGTARTLADPVERGAGSGGIAFAAAASGLLVYAPTGNDHELVWAGREGSISPIGVDRAAYRGPRLSPDGQTIVVGANDETRRPDLWVIDVDRRTRSRIRAGALAAVWTPDGRRIAHNGGGAALGLSSPDGRAFEALATSAEVRKWIAAGTAPYPTSWSPDGQYLLFEAGALDIWRINIRQKTFEPLLTGPAAEWDAVISPDGKLVAFTSDESGRQEVYVARWPGFDGRTALSTRGGTTPRWSKDSKEVFFWQGRTMMAAAVAPSMRVEIPRPLFSGDYIGAARDTAFDVAADGRFLLVKSDERAQLTQIAVLQNWIGARQ